MLQLNFTTEIIVSLLVAFILYYLLYRLTKRQVIFESSREAIIWKLIIVVKLVCAIAFAAIFYLKYPFTDTILYHEFSVYLNLMPYDSPLSKYRELYTTNGLNLLHYLNDSGYPMEQRDNFVRYPLQLILVFNSWLNVLLFNSFFAKTLVYSAMGYVGLLQLYSLFRTRYDSISQNYLLICCFAFPSLLFWSSGILKEPIVILGIGLSLKSFFEMSRITRINFKHVFLLCFGFALCYVLKPFIAILLLLFFSCFFLLRFFMQNRLTIILLLKGVVICAVLFVALYWILDSSLFEKYKLGKLFDIINKSFENISKRGATSGYQLPFNPKNIIDLIKLIPFALVLILFRPFVWECTNMIQSVAAFESIALLLFHAYVLVILILRRKVVNILKDPFLLSCAFICLVYFLLAAISSANFGTLVRYKILLFPFYLLLLVSLIPAKK